MNDRKSRTFTILMALGTFVVVMDNTIMNVSIQALVNDLQTTVSGVQAAIALNALIMAAFVLFGGKLADIIGMKKTFMTGVYIYIVGVFVASLSQNLLTFIAGWCVIQGFGAALMLPNVQTIIRSALSGRERVAAYGVMTGVNALGAAAGPIIGGFLTTYFSWRWAFMLEVVALLFLVFLQNNIPKDQPIGNRLKIDKLGTFLQASAMIAVVLGILLVSDYGLVFGKQPLVIAGREISPFNIGISPAIVLIGIGIIFLLLFVRTEARKAKNGQPTLVRLTLFKIADFVNGLQVRAIQVSVLAGILFTVPLFMQVSFGTSAFATGLALLPLSISLIVGAWAGVRASSNWLPKRIVQAGSLIVSLGALWLVASVNTGTVPIDLALGLGIFGFGSGLVGSQIVNLILSAVRPEETAEASGTASTLEQLGNSIGVAVLGTMLMLSLSLGLTLQFQGNASIPDPIKQQAQVIIERGVNIVSDQQIKTGLAGLDPAYVDQLVQIYDTARTDAFRITLLTVVCFGLLMFLMAAKLPEKDGVSDVES
jgi:MFS family permease